MVYLLTPKGCCGADMNRADVFLLRTRDRHRSRRFLGRSEDEHASSLRAHSIHAEHRPTATAHPLLSAIHTAAKTGSVAVSSTSIGPARKSIIMRAQIIQDGSFDLAQTRQ